MTNIALRYTAFVRIIRQDLFDRALIALRERARFRPSGSAEMFYKAAKVSAGQHLTDCAWLDDPKGAAPTYAPSCRTVRSQRRPGRNRDIACLLQHRHAIRSGGLIPAGSV